LNELDLKKLLEDLEPGDLNFPFSFAFILHGPLEDFLKARKMLRALTKSRLVHHTISTQRLWVVKDREWNALKKLREDGEV